MNDGERLIGAWLGGGLNKEAGVLSGRLGEYVEKSAGSDLDFIPGRAVDPDSTDGLPVDRLYHYIAQGKYALPFDFGTPAPKYLERLDDYHLHVPPEHMKKFIQDYDKDARSRNDFKDNVVPVRNQKGDVSFAAAENPFEESDYVREQHNKVLNWLKTHVDTGVTIGMG